jgi:hypothetical protein
VPGTRRPLRAMAELGPGPHRSGDIAERMGRKVKGVAPIRNGLISKGMVYSPAHGDTAFTVPLFDGLHEANHTHFRGAEETALKAHDLVPYARAGPKLGPNGRQTGRYDAPRKRTNGSGFQ